MVHIDEARHGPVVVMIPDGDMDFTTLPAFETRLDALLRENVRAVLWDLGDVGILPSTALGFLLQARRKLEAVGGYMALACLGRLVRSTLETMGVIDVFPVFTTREDGVRYLQERIGTS